MAKKHSFPAQRRLPWGSDRPWGGPNSAFPGPLGRDPVVYPRWVAGLSGRCPQRRVQPPGGV